jgi:hypothetical protein
LPSIKLGVPTSCILRQMARKSKPRKGFYLIFDIRTCFEIRISDFEFHYRAKYRRLYQAAKSHRKTFAAANASTT